MEFTGKAIMIVEFPWEVYKQDDTDESGVNVWAVIDWDWNRSHCPYLTATSCLARLHELVCNGFGLKLI